MPRCGSKLEPQDVFSCQPAGKLPADKQSVKAMAFMVDWGA